MYENNIKPAGREVLALSGGVGGAKLCLGLDALCEPSQLHIAVNTADDFEHFGLLICPDIDTLLYTLAGRSNKEQGWGLEGESWNALAALQDLDAETWFQLGDKDLATHLFRRQAINAGQSLSQVTSTLAKAFNIGSFIHPMTDDPVRTVVHVDGDVDGDGNGGGEGENLSFQHYFVKHRCEPAVSGFSFQGIESARINPRVENLLVGDQLAAIVICPSNPFVSVEPILALPTMRSLLKTSKAPVIAVSPIVAGAAIKGPTAKMMKELQMPVTAIAIAQYYADLIDILVIDDSDAELAEAIESLGIQVAVAPTVMRNKEDKVRLADTVLKLAAQYQTTVAGA